MYPRQMRGFTLLELLMVIAIIGILAAIVVDYAGRSKGRGADAGTQQNLVNARSQAEVYFANHEKSYEGVCNDLNLGIFRQVRSAARAQNLPHQNSYQDSSAGDATHDACHDSMNAYAAWVPLSRGGGVCIDSRNTTRISTDGLASNVFSCN